MPSSIAAAAEPALITASYGRQFLVRLAASGVAGEPAERVAVTRGKRTDPGIGDTVLVRRIGPDQAVIESVQPRSSEVRRSDRWRSKLLAANVDQVGIVLAGDPPFSEELALRILCACATAGVPVALIVNKSDLIEARAAIEPRLAVYRALGLPVFDIAAGGDPLSTRATLGRWLAGQTTLLVGQSGMGKSTLINTLVPDADLRTQAISSALASGKHTTTFSRLFDLPESVAADARIIDTPGFQSFGITHLSTSQLIHSMPEFGPVLGRCRFNDCSHRNEPGCAIRQAVAAGAIDSRRFELYGRLVSETINDPSRPRS
jgi:ribosome biogenesis GTPase